VNHCFSVRRPGKSDRVKNIALRRKTKIFGLVVFGVSVVEQACDDFRGALSVRPPGTGSVDCFTVHPEPSAHIEKDRLDFIGDRAVRARAYIEQQVAVLAHDIDELMNDEFWRLE